MSHNETHNMLNEEFVWQTSTWLSGWAAVSGFWSLKFLFLGFARVFSLERHEELVRTKSELLILHTVNYDIPATVGGQNPEGKKWEVAPFIPQNVADHEDGDGGEGCGKRHSQRPDCFGCLDVGEGRFGGALALGLGQVFPALRVLPDAGQRDDVNDHSSPQEGEVKGGEEKEDVPGLARELADGPQSVITHPAAGVVLQSDLAAENQRRHRQEEAPHPGEDDEDRGPFTRDHRVLVQWPQHGDAPLDGQQENGRDGDQSAPGEDGTDDVARVETHRLWVVRGPVRRRVGHHEIDLRVDGQRHHEDPHGQIGHGERRLQVALRRVEVFIP